MTPAREADFGLLVSRSFENLWAIRKPVAIYLAVVAVAAFTIPLLGIGFTSGGGVVIYLFGQYWLFQALLKTRGLLETQGNHLAPFLLLAMLLIGPIMVGIFALILPGLFLVARWIAAPAFVAARGGSAWAAAGGSWQTVRGHTGKIASIVVMMFLIASLFGTLGAAAGGLFAGIAAYRAAQPLNLIEAHLFPLMLLGLSVAVYELLGPRNTMIEDVFG
ncbi:MAG: hypothetical protein RSE14_00820 [Erythrobacter sp.]|jgi:hypothetical protein|uniref:hypothetical protein n=1 Tax=Erythrobacter sp. TaxID=1042 RepID=UPI002B472530|nr:hypothetical protein [Erythrobacter sp.]WRH70667.1 MAG: hypothetical protein RSE14_00820 [Erythrobacter sp.]